MKITIEVDAKEIAAFVLELQKRRNEPYKIETAVDLKAALTSALEAIRGKPEANGD